MTLQTCTLDTNGSEKVSAQMSNMPNEMLLHTKHIVYIPMVQESSVCTLQSEHIPVVLKRSVCTCQYHDSMTTGSNCENDGDFYKFSSNNLLNCRGKN